MGNKYRKVAISVRWVKVVANATNTSEMRDNGLLISASDNTSAIQVVIRA